MPLSSCEFCENLCSESHSLVKAVNEILPVYCRRRRRRRHHHNHHHHHHHHHHNHHHQGLDPLICSVSRVTTVLANVSLVFQLFSFLVICSDIISKGFGLMAFFASVKASSVCIHLSCPVCIQSAVHGYGVVCFVVMKGVACQKSQ